MGDEDRGYSGNPESYNRNPDAYKTSPDAYKTSPEAYKTSPEAHDQRKSRTLQERRAAHEAATTARLQATQKGKDGIVVHRGAIGVNPAQLGGGGADANAPRHTFIISENGVAVYYAIPADFLGNL